MQKSLLSSGLILMMVLVLPFLVEAVATAGGFRLVFSPY